MPDRRRFLLENAASLVTMNGSREVLADAWVAAVDGLVTAVGRGPAPQVIGGTPRADFGRYDARGCVVLPGLVNTHHHLYQTRTRAWRGAVDSELFPWLRTLYPVWARLSDDDFHRAVALVKRHDAIALTLDAARAHAHAACDALKTLPATAYREALEALPEFVVERAY